jgi:hypothetical protein
MRLRGAILCLLLALATGLRLEAQNFTTVTATNIQDGTGTKLPAGKLCFQATDQNDSPIAFRAGGGGQAINKSVCRDVAVGALTSSFQVANPANTSPLNILYRITVTNGSSEVVRYTKVDIQPQTSGGVFNFDNCACNPSTITPSTPFYDTVQEEGTSLAQRHRLNFIGANVTAADDAANSRTNVTISGASVPGADTQVIFNDGGVLGASSKFLFNKATGTARIGSFAGYDPFFDDPASFYDSSILAPLNSAQLSALGVEAQTNTSFKRAIETAVMVTGASPEGAEGVSAHVSSKASSGPTAELTGFDASMSNQSTGNVVRMEGYYSELLNTGGGTIGSAFGYYHNGTAPATNNYAFYTENMGSGAGSYAYYSAGGKNFLAQGTNGLDVLTLKRATDSGPTGNFENFKNAADVGVWTIDITGSLAAGTIPGARVSGNISGNAGTATALAADPGDCSGNNFALGINASGVAQCAQPSFANLSGSATDAQIPNNITLSQNPVSDFFNFTAIAAPATPAAGVGRVYVDSTNKVLSHKDDAGIVTNTVKPDTGTANNFLTAISAAGVISKAQPSFTNLSGSLALAQTPLTTRGDLLVADATPALARLPVGASGTVLIGGTDPSYSANPTVTTITGSHISGSANPASAGQVRLANADTIKMRNSVNSADLTVVDANGTLLRIGNGATIDVGGGYLTIGANTSGNWNIDGGGNLGTTASAIGVGSLIQRTPNGGSWARGQSSELLTLSTSGLTTLTTANLLPQDAIIEAVVVRVTTTITTSTNWAVGDATTTSRFCSANATLTAGTTSVCLNHMSGAVTTLAAGPSQAAAAKVQITVTGANPGAGAVRITVFWMQFVAPTS